MTKEREAESCVAADAIQAGFGDCLNLSDRVATQVGKLAGFEIAKDLLGRIELRRVARQAFDGQPRALVAIQSSMRRLRWAGRPSHSNTILRPGSS